MALQHLRSSTANKRPTPAAMSDGQIALNSNTASPGLFFKDSAGALIKVGPVHVGTTAPNASPASGGETGNTVGEQWLDTTGGTYVFKVWDGSAWRSETSTFVDVNGDTMTGALGIIAGDAATPGLFVSGDTNTGIYSPGADQVAISTNGTGRLFVDASGDVGINEPSPERKLHIRGFGSDSDDNLLRFEIDSPVSSDMVLGGLEFEHQDVTSPGVKGYYKCFSEDGGTDVYHAWGVSGGATVSEALRITSDGKVGIGTTSPLAQTHIRSTSAGSGAIALRLENNSGDAGTETILQFAANTSNSIIRGAQISGLLESGNGTNLLFYTNPNSASPLERARIDSSGRLLVGTSSALSVGSPTAARFQSVNAGAVPNIAMANFANASAGSFLVLGASRGTSVGTYTAVANNDRIGTIRFAAADGTDLQSIAAAIECYAEADAASNDTPGRLVFYTTADGSASPTERMRIDKAGNCLYTTPSDFAGIVAGTADGKAIGGTANSGVMWSSRNTTSAASHIVFTNPNGTVGQISTSASATSYSTSSDYRLKENVVPLTGAADRLNQLQVHRFNFIADPDTTVDGFIAHEAQAVVPECVTGTKDEVDDEGNPVYQGIDQSKLVPLLTAALQEALGRIETLEAEVAALKA